jgi:hypothetical protein
MTDDELRAMVRQAIARVQSGHSSYAVNQSHLLHPLHLSHFSHQTFTVPSGAEVEGACIIEPAVMCNHCGYCKSMGH